MQITAIIVEQRSPQWVIF